MQEYLFALSFSCLSPQQLQLMRVLFITLHAIMDLCLSSSSRFFRFSLDFSSTLCKCIFSLSRFTRSTKPRCFVCSKLYFVAFSLFLCFPCKCTLFNLRLETEAVQEKKQTFAASFTWRKALLSLSAGERVLLM